MEFCFCVVLYDYAAYGPAWNESETNFVHDTCIITKKYFPEDPIIFCMYLT